MGNIDKSETIKEFHLFAGIGGGIYGGQLLGHKCCGGVEINEYAQTVLKQRQKDGWMESFPVYSDICMLNGSQFQGTFDVLCGGFPCQAFSTAAHGKNISSKNLWNEMYRFVQEADAPIVFGENVVLRAISKAANDLKNVGYNVKILRLSCSDLGADHQRNRFWLLAIKDFNVFSRVASHLATYHTLEGHYWEHSPKELGEATKDNPKDRRHQLFGIGNAQSPFVAATAFRILVNRHLNPQMEQSEIPTQEEINLFFHRRKTWIQTSFNNIGLVHTPTTMANYCCNSMMKHQGCRNFKKVFGKADSFNSEYLMGFPLGASSLNSVPLKNKQKWLDSCK